MKALFSAALMLTAVALAGCTVHQTTTPGLTGPSALALSMRVTALPDSISQDGGSQSSVQVTAIGPDGKPKVGLSLRLDMRVLVTSPAPCTDAAPCPVVQDYGTLSARTIVTDATGVASAVYTAPPSPTAGIFGTCQSLPGNCVQIVATALGLGFDTATPERVTIRLVPPGVILPPAGSPTAAFTMSPVQAVQSSPVIFDASTSKPGAGATQITSYAWSFGDGTAAGSGVTVTHTFNAQGTFVVTLTVTNDRGLSVSVPIQTAVVAPPTPPAAALPTPTFTFSPAAPGVGDTVFFNASASTPGAGHTIASYAWTFGDGTTGTGATPSHAYTVAGSYSVQLKVTDEIGQSVTSAGTSISIGSPPAPTSSFTFSPSVPGRFDQVVFDASTSSTAQGQTIVDVAWNFGDGTPVIHCPGDPSCITTNGSNRISSHTYQTATTFIVNLVVTDSAGRHASSNKSITIDLGQPKVVITASPSSPTPGVTVQFNSDGTTYFSGSNPPSFPVSFTWTFGDGSGSALANPSHAYASIGAYTAGLSVTDNKGRTGVGTVTVNVVAVAPPTPPAAPVADFTFSPATPNSGAPGVNFDGTITSRPSGAAISTYRWNFGDGVIVSGVNGTPNHQYPAVLPSGTITTYQVTLTVTDTNGLSSSKQQSVPVKTP
jgi:PKD repeat protein